MLMRNLALHIENGLTREEQESHMMVMIPAGYENDIITIFGLDNQCIVQILAQDDQHIV